MDQGLIAVCGDLEVRRAWVVISRLSDTARVHDVPLCRIENEGVALSERDEMRYLFGRGRTHRRRVREAPRFVRVAADDVSVRIHRKDVRRAVGIPNVQVVGIMHDGELSGLCLVRKVAHKGEIGVG